MFLRDLVAYQPGKPIEELIREKGLSAEQIVKLASNENPLGMSERAKAAAIAALDDAPRYPEQYDLISALAAHLSVEREMIVLGNGSNDVLDLVARAFLDNGDEAVMAEYAFVVYDLATRAAGGTPVVVPAKEYGHDLGAMGAVVTPRTKVVWIANPNNPTGTLLESSEIKFFLERVSPNVLVVLDEAYYEYLESNERTDTTRWLREHENLIITRTFSKVYGLAGLRIGYGLMHPRIATALNRVRQPFNVNRIGLAAAIAALGDQEFVAQSTHVNTEGRRKLTDALRILGIQIVGRAGNFVTIQLKDAARVNELLLTSGVIVRPLSSYGMHNFLRVTIGTRGENERFLEALKAALEVYPL